ncbi:MAG TPA: serine/threonine-protein kinase [Kofleriaceae bacterium]|nr:serine/threonine-protein kinase [Kofleriaceae bacterium]
MTDIRLQRSGSTVIGAILGNYRVLEPLSHGDAGSMYRAEHTVLGRPAAVKILRPELTTNPELVHRFLNEAKAATLIRHPGIVEVYDFGAAPDGTWYIVMELLGGASLASRLGERGRLPEAEAAFIARGVASALRAAHQQGIIHRDLRPDNVFLVPDPDGPTGERIKVLDFGIAKLTDPKRTFQTQAGALIGTPIYMPPEQARGASVIDHRADLYALGCMLYQMLAGRPPFVSPNAAELIKMHLDTAPEPPSRYAPVSPQLEQIVMRLLEKEPGARFQHGGELIEAIDPLLGSLPGAPAGGPVAARPSVPAGIGAPLSMPLSLADERAPDTREPRSSMGLIAGLITVGIAAAVGLLLALRGGGDDEPKPTSGDGSDGSATATEVAPTPAPAPAPEPPPKPAPASRPTPAPVPQPPKQADPPADRPAATPKQPRPAKPTSKPTPDKPAKPGDRSGPVTHPDGPITRPDPGPITSPSGGGSSSKPPEPPPKPAEPPPKPAEPPPPPPPADKLPDKPSEATP